MDERTVKNGIMGINVQRSLRKESLIGYKEAMVQKVLNGLKTPGEQKAFQDA